MTQESKFFGKHATKALFMDLLAELIPEFVELLTGDDLSSSHRNDDTDSWQFNKVGWMLDH